MAVAAAVAGLVVVSLSGCGTLRAGGVLRDALGPANALVAEVSERVASVPSAHGTVRVVLTRPRDADGPLPAFLLCPGAVADGADDPRMRAFARAVAARGATVASVDLEALRRFRVDALDAERLADVVVWLCDRADLVADGRVAVLGICVGGSHALVAARRERFASRASAVFVFGSYPDLGALVTRWLVTPAESPELMDPVTEGRRQVLRGNLERLVDAGDVPAVRSVIDALLDGDADVRDPSGMSPRALRALGAARSEEPLDADLAAALIAPLAADFAALSPVPATDPGVPVYVLHAVGDPVVPFAYGEALRDALARAGADVRFHGTDLFAHVATEGAPSLFDAWPLLRFFADFLEDGGL